MTARIHEHQAGRLPASVRAVRRGRGSDRSGRRADRGRRPDRRRRPGRARLRDPPRPAARGVAGDSGAARRRPGRGRREGQEPGLAPALRRRRQSARAPSPLQGPADDGRRSELRAGARRGRLPADEGRRPCGSRRRRRCATTATGSSRSRSSPASSPSRRSPAARRSCRRRTRRSCSSPTAACTASAPATRAAAATGSRSAHFEPGSDIVAKLTVLAEGTQGHLTGAALARFGLEGEQPQIWALGVKEVWKVPKPLEHIVHTMGWPLRKRAKYGEFGGSFIYPMGDGHGLARLRRRARVQRRRVLGPRRAAGVQDAPARPQDPPRRRADRLGREDDHRGRLPRAAEAVPRAGPAARGRERGTRQRADAEGDPLRDRVRDHGGGGGVPVAPARRVAEPRRRARVVRRGAARQLRGEGSARGPEHAPGLRQGVLHGRRARERDDRDEGQPAAEGATRSRRTPSAR